MGCGAVPILAAYSVIVTIILVIISSLYSKTNTYQPQRTCIDGEEIQQTETHVDVMNIDLSSNGQTGKVDEDGECKCETLAYLGFELFEVIILSLLGIGVIFAGYKMITEGKTWLKKWKENATEREEAKFEKMRARLEASTSRGSGDTKKERRRTRDEIRADRTARLKYELSYEKGDNMKKEYVEEDGPAE